MDRTEIMKPKIGRLKFGPVWTRRSLGSMADPRLFFWSFFLLQVSPSDTWKRPGHSGRKNQTDPQNQPGSGGNTTTEDVHKQASGYQIGAIIGFTILAVLFIGAASVGVYFAKQE
ncbi:uncharacterized protein V6R79_013058 [Siganus canaliculatus]